MPKSPFEFYINVDGDIVIDKESFTSLLDELDKISETNEQLRSWKKKEFCCTVKFNGKFLDNYQYKEYPILAEGVCIRHTLNRCGTVIGCSGSMSKGECEDSV
ncbi:hypothetical protein [Bacillus safensis]|uniref:hypothetical protein n=1 Tax=Bacillus safensis TaxID=561879 RepID=UPI00398244FA